MWKIKHIGGDPHDSTRHKMKKCPYNKENKEEHNKIIISFWRKGKY